MLLLIPQDETSTANAAAAEPRAEHVLLDDQHRVADCSVPAGLRLPPKCQLDQNVIADLQLAA
jgi:hypothetical protein